MRILFVCEGNVNRSQMAAAFFSRCTPVHTVSTAGTLVPPEHEGQPVSIVLPNSVPAMALKGIDMSNAVMHRLTPNMVDEADIVVLVGPTEGGPLPEFLIERADRREWGVPDPGYGSISFEGARDRIELKALSLAEELGATKAAL